jgi:hypothetical protein
MEGQDFTICLPVLPPSLTQGKARASGQANHGFLATSKHYQQFQILNGTKFIFQTNGTNFIFGPTSKSLWILNYKIQNKSNLSFVSILKGFKHFGNNLINSPKFYHLMIFMNMNLDGLTCIKKFEVPLQVTIMTRFK